MLYVIPKTPIIAGIMQHIEEAGIHSGDSSCVLPAVSIREETLNTIRDLYAKAGTRTQGHRIGEPAIRDPARSRWTGPRLRHRGQSASIQNNSVRFEGHRDPAGKNRVASHDRP